VKDFLIWVALLASFEGERAAKGVLATLEFPSRNPVTGPLVSIIIPTYQERRFIAQCIKSIHNQDYKSYEIIVADSSTDETPDIARDLGAVVVRVPYGNLSRARNEGARVSIGELLFFIDADCLLAHTTLRKLVDDILKPGIVLAWGGNCSYEDGLHKAYWALSKFLRTPYETARGVLVWRKCFFEIGGYDENVNPLRGEREDIDFGTRMMRRYGRKSISYDPFALIGVSVRREKRFGYPFRTWDAAGVRDEVL